MRICLDYRPALHEGTGVGTYVRGLARALADPATGLEPPAPQVCLFSASWRHRVDTSPVPGAQWTDARIPVRALDWLWHRRGWPPIERWVGDIDIAHSPSPMLLPTRRARRVVTVHDCYFIRHPEDVAGPVRRDYVPLLRAALAKADAVATVSECTKQELADLLPVAPERIHVTPLGVDSAYAESNQREDCDAILDEIGVDPGYFLFVGRREPRKNLDLLMRGFAALAQHQPHARLLLVGPEGYRWPATWASAPQAARDRTRLLPHQPARRLAALYQGAAALLLTSRWEGFGLTAIEALACGTPVIATPVGALPEVLGEHAIWIDNSSPDELAHACEQLLLHPERQGQLAEARIAHAGTYTWERTARRTQSLYAGLA